MAEPTKTIAVRVSLMMDEQIETLAATSDQTKSEWIREQLTQSVQTGILKQSPPHNRSIEPARQSDGLSELQLRETEARILQATKTAIQDAVKSLHGDLCKLGQLTLDLEELVGERIDADCLDVIEIIERLKQSQRSHNRALLRAVNQLADQAG